MQLNQNRRAENLAMRSMIIREAFADFYGLSELQPYSLYARAGIDRGYDDDLRLRDTALPITMAGLHTGFEFSRSSQLCNTKKAAVASARARASASDCADAFRRAARACRRVNQ